MEKKLIKLKDKFFKDLTENTLKFWYDNGLDWNNGGLNDFLDQYGEKLTDEKGGWVQGRVTWLWSWVYNNVDKDSKWLKAADNCYKFLDEKCFDENGRMYFRITGEGEPVVQRRYLFTEVFGIIGLAEYSKASGNKAALEKALKTLELMDDLLAGKDVPGCDTMPSKVTGNVPATRGHSMTMIVISMFQILRDVTGDVEKWNARIDKQIDDLFTYFVKPEKQALMECVLEDGSILDTPEGRTLNPGHAIETVWFLLEEAKFRKDKLLAEKLFEILDWSYADGWDKKYGGLYSFLDVDGHQAPQIEWENKYWWPQCETIYAMLLAYHLTGEEHYFKKFKQIYKWSYKHFPDKDGGEWFGYLRRDGSVSSTIKGNHFKGPFHIPRMQAKCYLLLQEMEEKGKFFDWSK